MHGEQRSGMRLRGLHVHKNAPAGGGAAASGGGGGGAVREAKRAARASKRAGAPGVGVETMYHGVRGAACAGRC